jgi:WD40 repeat protein
MTIFKTENSEMSKNVFHVNVSQLRNFEISPNGKFIVTTSDDNIAIIWDVETGVIHATLARHTRNITGVVFFADSKRIATTSHDRSTCIWDVHTGELLFTMRGHNGGVLACALSSNCRRIVTTGYAFEPLLWDAENGDFVSELTGHSKKILLCVFSSDNEYIITTSKDITVRIWNSTSGTIEKILDGNNRLVSIGAFSSDAYIQSDGGLGRIRFWNLDILDVIDVLDILNIMGVIEDENVSKGSTQYIKTLQNDRTHCSQASQASHTSQASHASQASHVSQASQASQDTEFVNSLVGTSSGYNVICCEFSQDDVPVVRVVIERQSEMLICGGNTLDNLDSIIRLNLIKDNSNERTSSCAFSYDDRHIVLGGDKGTVWILNSKTGVLCSTLIGHVDKIKKCIFTEDGKHVLVSTNTSLRMWCIETEQYPNYDEICNEFTLGININHLSICSDIQDIPIIPIIAISPSIQNKIENQEIISKIIFYKTVNANLIIQNDSIREVMRLQKEYMELTREHNLLCKNYENQIN